MFWTGLLANQREVFAVQCVRFRSGVPDGSRVGQCSHIAVRVACRLLCQFFHHVECVEHQLRHVDCTRANPHYRGNNLLLHGRHAFTYLTNCLDQVFTHYASLAPGYVHIIITADTRNAIIDCLAVCNHLRISNECLRPLCGRTQNGNFFCSFSRNCTIDKLPLVCIYYNHSIHKCFAERLAEYLGDRLPQLRSPRARSP